jgi:hypothetical protein
MSCIALTIAVSRFMHCAFAAPRLIDHPASLIVSPLSAHHVRESEMYLMVGLGVGNKISALHLHR